MVKGLNYQPLPPVDLPEPKTAIPRWEPGKQRQIVQFQVVRPHGLVNLASRDRKRAGLMAEDREVAPKNALNYFPPLRH
jgi:hypothetical protein